MADFASILKKTIEEKGVTQKWLADAADTKEATISRYINGVNKSPNVEILVRISKALDVSADYLLGITDIKTADEERRFLNAYNRSSERDKSIIKQLLDI